MVGNLITQQSRFAVVRFPNNGEGQEFKFDRIPDLDHNNILITGIEAFNSDQLTKSPDGATVVSPTGAKGLTVTLFDENGVSFVDNMPVQNYVRSANGGFVPLIADLKISLPLCRVKINDNSDVSVNETVCFMIYFQYQMPEQNLANV